MNNKCPYSELCGGCTLQGVNYAKQLKKKEEYLTSLLNKFGKIEPIIGMENPFNYRNKVQVTFGYDYHHQLICGNYASDSHQLIDIKDCLICDETANKIIESIKRLVKKYHISVFDEQLYKGALRHVLIRTTNLNEVMVVLVTGGINFVKKDLFLKDLIKYNPEITTVVQNINNKRTSMILGDKNLTLHGKGYIYDELCGLKFKISASSFYQVNKRQTSVLYNTALQLADFKGNEILIDAYCGTGTIGLIAAAKVKQVIGVELNKNAIRDAITNSKNNKITNAEFIADDAGHFMTRLANERKSIDAIIMDPPRSGADDKFLKAIYKLRPTKIIYVSCGPESLKNNLINLTRNGYQVKKIQPVDMFPHTNHVETVVLLSKVHTPGI